MESDVEQVLESLFRPHKTIRDAVWGDIMLTRLEIRLIDTADFQRLHSIRQLGTAHLVYPTANHTRFDHSLGCLHTAQRIIDIVNSNPFRDVSIEPRDRLLVRLTALLHDLAHIPFGHTLEDEGGLFPSQWTDPNRVTRFLGKDSEVANAILTNEMLLRLEAAGLKEFSPQSILDELTRILQAMEDKTVDRLPKPFIADIVGNTLCADLLDYIKRDMFFAGLREDYDDRFLSYLYVSRHGNKPRLMLRLIKPSTQRIRRDVLGELLHLLRLRYSLAEKIYFHHAKVSSSAMVIAAVGDMLFEGKISVEKLYPVGDDRLLAFLASAKASGRSQMLIKNFYARKIYKPIYGLKYGGDLLEVPAEPRKAKLIEDMRKWKLRTLAERSLEQQNQLPPGSVTIYCPAPKMGRKELKVLVNMGGSRIGPLNETAPERVLTEIRTSITSKHDELWTFYVFVDPSVASEKRRTLQGDCNRMFNVDNDLEECEGYRDPNHNSYLRRLDARYAREHPAVAMLEQSQMTELPSFRRPGLTDEEARYSSLIYEEYCKIRDGQAHDKQGPKAA